MIQTGLFRKYFVLFVVTVLSCVLLGGLANMLACHLGFSETERADVAAFWQTDGLASGPGLKAVDMFRAIHDGRIRFLWVMAKIGRAHV